MIQQFINREAELKFMEKKHLQDHAQLIIIYGRRRVGKTELIKQFIQEKKSIYLLCTNDSLQENYKETKRKFHEHTGKDYFLKLETDSYYDLFKYLLQEIQDKKLIIVLDEFPHLIELEKGIPSVFQKIWDELLKDKMTTLLLSGSSIGMMETEVLGYKSPLYGRRTGEWKVEPFSFKDLTKMFQKTSTEERVKIWSIFGGTPYYLAQINPENPVEENIKTQILSKGEILYNEPKILLKEEFREPKTYMLILKYLSLGYNTHGKLSTATGIEKGNLSKYLSVLRETRLVEYTLPLGQRKRGIYHITDPYFKFWFRFIYPNRSDLEIGLIDEVYTRIESQINPYYGAMFEQLIFELMKTKKVSLPFPFTDVRKWWHKDKEIDLIALNTNTKQIMFCECKWKEQVDAKRLLQKLKETSKHVQWHNQERKEHYAIFARSYREKIKDPNLTLYDLKDI